MWLDHHVYIERVKNQQPRNPDRRLGTMRSRQTSNICVTSKSVSTKRTARLTCWQCKAGVYKLAGLWVRSTNRLF